MSIRFRFAQGTLGLGQPRGALERHKTRAVEPKPYCNPWGVRLVGMSDNAAPTRVRYTRLVADKILVTFHEACAEGDGECAVQSLRVLQMMLDRRPLAADGSGRRDLANVVAEFQRRRRSQHLKLEEY